MADILLRSTILSSKYSSEGEKQSIYELIIHHRATGVNQINHRKHRPDRAETSIHEDALTRAPARVQPQTKQVHNQPCVQGKSDHAVLDQNFQVRVVEVKIFFMKVANPTRKLTLQSLGPPALQRIRQEHVPASLIHRNAKLH